MNQISLPTQAPHLSPAESLGAEIAAKLAEADLIPTTDAADIADKIAKGTISQSDWHALMQAPTAPRG